MQNSFKIIEHKLKNNEVIPPMKLPSKFGKSLPICQVTYFHQFSCFCIMSRAQQREVCFNLFCVRIEVRMLILQYLRGPVHFQVIVCQ